MRDVIQVDNRAQLRCQGIFLFRRIVGGKHNLLALGADRITEHQFRFGGTVTATAVFP